MEIIKTLLLLPFLFVVFRVTYEITLVIISRCVNFLIWKNVGDKFVIISGATDGIGRAIALQLAKKGKKLLLLGRNPEKLANVQKEALVHLKKEENCLTAVYDFSTEQDFSQLPEIPIGILINNAGVSAEHPEFIEEETQSVQMINVNNLNLVKLTQACIPRMKEFSYIINIGSGFADLDTPLMASYSATKAFVKQFSRSIFLELAPKKIFVQYVAPNMVSTKMTKTRPTFFTPSAETFASAFVSTIGSHNTISPYMPHTIQNLLLSFLPRIVFGPFVRNYMLKIRTAAISKKLKAQKD